MNDANKLAFVLKFLNEEWDKVVSMMSSDQLSYLQNELEGLETRLLRSQKDPAKTLEVAKGFFPVFTNIKPLQFLANPEGGTTRTMSLSDQSAEELEKDITEILLKRLKKLKEKY